MNNNVYNIKNIAGKYCLYFGDDTENVLSILSYNALYCDLLQ